MLASVSGYALEQSPPSEYEVKSSFIYHFFTFVEWPAAVRSQAEVVRACVIGDLPAGQNFDDLNHATVWNRTLVVDHISDIAEFPKCQLIFIASSEGRRLSKILQHVKRKNILTVGDTPGYARRGVIINFYTENNKVRFDINMAAADKAGLVISSKLLRLARSIYGVRSGGE